MTKHPDPIKHKNLSLIKSVIRILGYCLIAININLAVIVLIISEVIGIIEEMV